MPTILEEIEQKRFFTEWHLPVSTRLSIRDLTLLASSCKSVGCHLVVFSYSAAVGRPLPEIPKQDDLQKIAQNAGLVKILTRLDIEDIGELMVSTTARDKNSNNKNAFINLTTEQIAEKNVAIINGIQKFLSQAAARFDILSILLKQDPFLFETLNVNEIFTPFLTKCPLIINIDDCPTSQIILPRQRVPQGAVLEFSQCRLIDSKNNFDINLLSTLRKQLSNLKRYRILVSCGGENIFPNDVESAVISKIRSQLDSACLMESLCGRSDFLATNKRLSLNFILRMKAIEAKRRQKEARDKTCVGEKMKLRSKRKLLLQEKQKNKTNKKKAKKAVENVVANNTNNKNAKKQATNNKIQKTKTTRKRTLVKISKSKEGDENDERKKVVPLTSNLLAQILRSQLVSKQAINRRTAIRVKQRNKKAKAMAGLQKKQAEKMEKKLARKKEQLKNRKTVAASEKTEPELEQQIVPEESFAWAEDI